MKKIFTLLFVLSFGLLFSNTSKINDDKIVACPTATITYSGSPFCTNTSMPQNVSLTGTDAYTGGVFSSVPVGLTLDPMTGAITPSLSTPGSYTVTYTIPSGGSCPDFMATAAVTILGDDQITPTSAFMNQTVCINQPIINITAATTYATGASATGLPPGVTSAWSSNTITIFGVPTVPGTYNYTIYTTGGNCFPPANYSGTIIVLPYPGASVNSSSVCSGSSATVTATPSTAGTYSYSWTVPAGATNPGNVASFSTTVAGTYSVVLNNTATGCSGTSASGTVTIGATATATIASNQTICSGDTAMIFFTGTPNAIVTYNINGGANQNIVLTSSGNATLTTGSLTTTSTYNLVSVSSASGCSSPVSGSATVIVTLTPTVTVNSSTVCSGTSAMVMATSGTPGSYNYAWTVPSGAPNPGNVASFTTTTAGTYSVIITNVATVCSTASASGTVTILPSPAVDISLTSPTICSGEQIDVLLTSSIPGAIIYWQYVSPNVTGSSVGAGIGPIHLTDVLTLTNGVTIPKTVTYTVYAEANGCMGSPRTINITVTPIPSVMASPGSETINSGGITNISLTGMVSGTTYSWVPVQSNVFGATAGSGNIINQQLALTNPIQSGTVDYIITPNVNGCIGSPITVTVNVNINLSVKNFNSHSFSLSPNPVTDILNIKNNQIINKVTAFNQLGQIVLEKECNNNEVQLDFSGLKTGIYFITVDSDKKQSTFKIVKN